MEKENAKPVKKSVEKFRGEFKKSIITALVAAFGFLISLAWRDVIVEAVDKITALTPLHGKIISAIVITIISVIGILIITKVFSEKDENTKD